MEWLRSELVGPSLDSHYRGKLRTVSVVDGTVAPVSEADQWLPVFHRVADSGVAQELFVRFRDNPRSRYAVGLLHPDGSLAVTLGEAAPVGDDEDGGGYDEEVEAELDAETSKEGPSAEDNDVVDEIDDDAPGFVRVAVENIPIEGPDRRRPSTMGVSFFADIPPDAAVSIRLPTEKQFSWQKDGRSFPVNGWYRRVRQLQSDGCEREAWARLPVSAADCGVEVFGSQLHDRHKMTFALKTADGCPLRLQCEVFPRRMKSASSENAWLLTIVLRNATPGNNDIPEQSRILFQSLFEVTVTGGCFLPYPESQVDPMLRDRDEQSLSLLYQDFATWGIGHRCSAAWDCEPGEPPAVITADVMPAVETPSMTPDLMTAAGERVVYSMRDLSLLPPWQPNDVALTWQSLGALVDRYRDWIDRLQSDAVKLSPHHRETADRHISACLEVYQRMKTGLDLLKRDSNVMEAFRLANKAMLLQQIATKTLSRRPLAYAKETRSVFPSGAYRGPDDLLNNEQPLIGVGSWRAFQIAFLLMSVDGCARDDSPDKTIVDLIWFPTGGGKTEAYLGVAAFCMFYERLRQHEEGGDALDRHGTNVLMRYTLRLLTTQQFQRAASLVCAMEHMRLDTIRSGDARLGQRPFALGLWIGNEATPGSNEAATREIGDFRLRGGGVNGRGNPLVLNECPWCRAEIGAYVFPDGPRPVGFTQRQWNNARVKGLADVNDVWHLRCPCHQCAFGGNNTIPVHVIDENIYALRPSMVIGTVDKFAQLAFKPEARGLFGLAVRGGAIQRTAAPPGLILQDELHLISGPLGSVFGLYEATIEKLCTSEYATGVKPKIICSTATIRGAAEQVLSIFGRPKISLFPSPGVHIGDSYFGVFARRPDGCLDKGRMYLGVHAENAGSFATAQVRTFARLIQAVGAGIADENLPGTKSHRRDPWWTLLLFFNSIRELGQAGTLWQGDVPGRLRYLRKRDGTDDRYINRDTELSGRLLQDELVTKLEELAVPYTGPDSVPKPLDVVRASSIIEVGVDVDRLSVLGVAGQPKTTAQYIQVTGRVGRRWSERPGLIVMMYDATKARDRSHYENFHGYHRRLYEQVEPTSATPFAAAAIERALSGALLSWVRQNAAQQTQLSFASHSDEYQAAVDLLRSRCNLIEDVDRDHSIASIERSADKIKRVWESSNHTSWHKWVVAVDDRPLMRTGEQYVSALQRRTSFATPTSMRQVDRQGQVCITQIDISMTE